MFRTTFIQSEFVNKKSGSVYDNVLDETAFNALMSKKPQKITNKRFTSSSGYTQTKKLPLG